MLVGNQLIPRGDSLSNRAESNRVHINGAVVRVTEADGTLIREFTSLATGFADAASSNTPAYASVGIIALDAPTRDILLPSLPNRVVSKTVLINIKAFGTSLGGKDVESGEFQLPMQVCNGCLVDFSTGQQRRHREGSAELPEAASDVRRPRRRARASSVQDEARECQDCVKTREACDPTKLNP